MCAGKDIKKRKLPSIPKGIKNNKSTKPNKKKDDEVPSREESPNSSEQHLDEEKSEEKEKQQGGRIIGFTEDELHFQASESNTPVETKSEDVTVEGMKTCGERNDSKRKTEDIRDDEEDARKMGRLLDGEKPSPQTEGGGSRAKCEKSDGSVEEGRDMNTAPQSKLPLQREEDREAQENRKPSIITGENSKAAVLKRRNARAAASIPETLLQKLKARDPGKRHSKVPKETGKEEIAS